MAKKKEDSKEEAKSVVQMPDYNAKAVRGAKCISCNVSIVNDPGAVKFSCPSCGKYAVIRCSNCRKIVAKYKCPLCGFEGPN
jgi:Zn-ribbon RNA-binding protein